MSRAHVVAMPKWGLSMEEGVIVAWHRQPGETVSAGEELIDVETSKITNSIEAPANGLLRRILAPVGATATCGAGLAIIAPADVPEEEIDALALAQATRQADPESGTTAPPVPIMATIAHAGGTTRIRYLDLGSGGVPVVLIHGFGGDLDTWALNQPRLAEQGRTIALDLPGHGGSDKAVADGSAAALAGTVVALLDEIAPGPFHLVAHSFGAMVAREIAALRPERTLTVVGIAPADLGPVARGYVDGFLDARRRSDLVAALGLLFASPALATKGMADTLLRYKRLDGVDGALRAIDAAGLSGERPLEAALAFWSGLGRRGLLIWGARDAVVPPGTAATDIPGVALRMIDEAGHMPQIERPDQVNALIAAHVAAHAGPDEGGDAR